MSEPQAGSGFHTKVSDAYIHIYIYIYIIIVIVIYVYISGSGCVLRVGGLGFRDV